MRRKSEKLEHFKQRTGRIPLPKKTGGAHSTKKGKKGYDRKTKKQILEEQSNNPSGVTPDGFNLKSARGRALLRKKELSYNSFALHAVAHIHAELWRAPVARPVRHARDPDG